MKWAFDDIRKFRKGDIWVDSFTGQSKSEVLEVDGNRVKLKATWFDPCVMDWKSDIIETGQDAFGTEAHFRPALVENRDGTKNRCIGN